MKGDRVPVCVTLTHECKKMLKDSAKSKGISQAAVMELAVRLQVELWKNETQEIR